MNYRPTLRLILSYPEFTEPSFELRDLITICAQTEGKDPMDDDVIASIRSQAESKSVLQILDEDGRRVYIHDYDRPRATWRLRLGATVEQYEDFLNGYKKSIDEENDILDAMEDDFFQLFGRSVRYQKLAA